MKKNIAILTGGYSSEREISLASAEVVRKHLPRDAYHIFLVDISSVPWSVFDDSDNIGEISLYDFSALMSSETIHFDAVFVAMHGTPAEDGKIQGYFDMLKIPYTANSVLASCVTFDKDICKQLVRDIPVKQAQSVLCHTTEDVAEVATSLSFPVFVKPNKNGSSYGVSKISDPQKLEEAISKALEYDDEVLVEEFIDGRELACGVFDDGKDIITFPVTEIIPDNEFFDYEAKYKGKSQEITPANINPLKAKECQHVAQLIYKKLKLSGAVRVDFFLKGNDIYLLEVNTIPGLSAESILPQQARAYGWTLDIFFSKMIEACINASK